MYAELFSPLQRGNLTLKNRITQAPLKEAHPITHMGISAGYKRAIIPVLVKRTVNQASDLAKSA